MVTLQQLVFPIFDVWEGVSPSYGQVVEGGGGVLAQNWKKKGVEK